MSRISTSLMIAAPGNNVISYHRQPLYFSEDDKYTGRPGDVDEAWDVLLEPHCVDTIRRSLMCKADLAMYTAYWIADHTALPSKELRSNSDTVRPGPFEKQPE
ncbi:hypothetical protein CC78DRAFT_556600 [Lojkania enalia]|uniref:Uncharacterized protein n=1 Tax=Lojkania enalia TaxID=147567 RepID=A0A9P4JXL6_9PLEO|nr:hypothetical protein CC78DRAFT_556600 [Didymosphaeria enalia]